MKKQTKVKLSLISTIGVSLLAVSSAAVSTFAWFQAQAQVNVSAQSADPVQITVSAPDATPITAVLYAYNDNGAVGYSSASTLTFSNFSSATSNTSKNLWPGRKMSYCVKIDTTGNLPDLTISVSSLDLTNATTSKRVILQENNSVISATTNYINVQNQIQMVGYFITSTSVSTSNMIAGKINSTFQSHIIQSEQWSTTNIGASTIYFFYTIEFLDSTKYIEYDYVNSEYIVQTTTPLSTSTNYRYFLLDNSNGTSNCYAGLSVGLNGLSITAN